MLSGIAASTLICSLGIYILLEKNKEKRAAIHSAVQQTDQEEGTEMEQVSKEHTTQIAPLNS